MRLSVAYVFTLMIWTVGIAESAEDRFDHALLDRVLGSFVNAKGHVDYTALKANPDDLTAYVEWLNQNSPMNQPDRFPSRDHELAYWLNAYNAFVLSGVVDAYPVASVRDILPRFGFFKKLRFNAGGKLYTLDEIEHKIIRKTFGEPRIHAAINCASIGCPRLAQRAFRADELSDQLEKEMSFFILSSGNVRLDKEKKKVYLSEIFSWFKKDFTEWYKTRNGLKKADILDYVKLYMSDEDRKILDENAKFKTAFSSYDWSLNDQAQ